MTRQQAGVSAPLYGKPTLTFGDGEYSCASCGLGMREPCQHWRGFLEAVLATAPPEQAGCPDCDEAAKHAYSDATTPGFFYSKCERHRDPPQAALRADDGVAQEEAQLLARYDKALQTQQAAPKLHGTFTIADLPEDQPQGIMPFDLNDWKRRFAYNSEAAERNSSMDSGWSARTADDCLRRAAMLWTELAIAIAKTGTKPEDLFDRPDLVDVQEAARFATTPIKEEHGRC